MFYLKKLKYFNKKSYINNFIQRKTNVKWLQQSLNVTKKNRPVINIIEVTLN